MKIVCQDCGENFEFSEGEQKHFKSMGYVPPKRCKECNKRRKLGLPNLGYGSSSFWSKSETYGTLEDVRGGLYTIHNFIINYTKDNKLLYIKRIIKDKKSFITTTLNKDEATLFYEEEANDIQKKLISLGRTNVNTEMFSFTDRMRKHGDKAAAISWNLIEED